MTKFFIKLTLMAFSLLFLSCENEAIYMQAGCNAPCNPKKWLTFEYDRALLFHDTTSKLTEALTQKDLSSYVNKNSGVLIDSSWINNIDQALSCKIWTCSDDTIRRELYDPKDLITFIKKDSIVAYIVPCFKSKLVFCFPDSKNKDATMIDSFIYRILKADKEKHNPTD